jgi:hypothetical protein
VVAERAAPVAFGVAAERPAAASAAPVFIDSAALWVAADGVVPVSPAVGAGAGVVGGGVVGAGVVLLRSSQPTAKANAPKAKNATVTLR